MLLVSVALKSFLFPEVNILDSYVSTTKYVMANAETTSGARFNKETALDLWKMIKTNLT